jgi:hypothetical protein
VAEDILKRLLANNKLRALKKRRMNTIHCGKSYGK